MAIAVSQALVTELPPLAGTVMKEVFVKSSSGIKEDIGVRKFLIILRRWNILVLGKVAPPYLGMNGGKMLKGGFNG